MGELSREDKEARFRELYGSPDPEAAYLRRHGAVDPDSVERLLEGFPGHCTVTGRTEDGRPGLDQVAQGKTVQPPERFLGEVSVQRSLDYGGSVMDLVLGRSSGPYRIPVTMADLLEAQRVIHEAIARGGPGK